MYTFLGDVRGVELDGYFENFKKIVGEKERYFRKPKGETTEHEDLDEGWGGGDDTEGLIQRL